MNTKRIADIIGGLDKLLNEIDGTVPEVIYCLSEMLIFLSVKAGVTKENFVRIMEKHFEDIQKENKE